MTDVRDGFADQEMSRLVALTSTLYRFMHMVATHGLFISILSSANAFSQEHSVNKILFQGVDEGSYQSGSGWVGSEFAVMRHSGVLLYSPQSHTEEISVKFRRLSIIRDEVGPWHLLRGRFSEYTSGVFAIIGMRNVVVYNGGESIVCRFDSKYDTSDRFIDVGFFPNQRYVATVLKRTSNSIDEFYVQSMNLMDDTTQEWPLGFDDARCIKVNHEGTICVVGRRKIGITVLNSDTGELVAEVDTKQFLVDDIMFTRNKDKLVVCADGKSLVGVDPETWNVVFRWRVPNDADTIIGCDVSSEANNLYVSISSVGDVQVTRLVCLSVSGGTVKAIGNPVYHTPWVDAMQPRLSANEDWIASVAYRQGEGEVLFVRPRVFVDNSLGEFP